MRAPVVSSLFCCLSIVLIPSILPAQTVIQSSRAEFQLRNGDTDFEIIPASDQGIFLYRTEFIQDGKGLELIKLDTSLTVMWRGFLPVDPHQKLIDKRIQKDKVYLLFRNDVSNKNNFRLVALNQATGDFLQYEIRNYIPFSLVDFQVTDSAALLGGYFNRVPVVTHFSFKNSKSKILPGLLNEIGELTQVRTNADGSFDVLIAARNYTGQKTIWIKSYDHHGELVRNMALEPEDNKNLIFGRSLKLENNVQIIAGVFGAQRSEWSRGFFIASLDPSGMQNIRYYNFHELQNFFKYMKAKRELRVKKRIERRKIRGKKIKFNYRFLVHELVPYNNQFVLLGEAFYPRYTSPSQTGFFAPYSFGANQQFQNGRIFDGYYYTHAAVMGFDTKGNVVWDNSFEINDVKTFTLQQFVRLEMQGDKIILLYLYEGQLRSKIIQGNEVLEGKAVEPIHTYSTDDLVLREDARADRLEYWYKSYFVACGVQEILNAQLGRRKVFYINKVSYTQ